MLSSTKFHLCNYRRKTITFWDIGTNELPKNELPSVQNIPTPDDLGSYEPLFSFIYDSFVIIVL